MKLYQNFHQPPIAIPQSKDYLKQTRSLIFSATLTTRHTLLFQNKLFMGIKVTLAIKIKNKHTHTLKYTNFIKLLDKKFQENTIDATSLTHHRQYNTNTSFHHFHNNTSHYTSLTTGKTPIPWSSYHQNRNAHKCFVPLIHSI